MHAVGWKSCRLLVEVRRHTSCNKSNLNIKSHYIGTFIIEKRSKKTKEKGGTHSQWKKVAHTVSGEKGKMIEKKNGVVRLSPLVRG